METLVFKRRIPHREHLVNQQDIRLQMSRDGKPQPHFHAGGVGLHGGVEGVADIGEGDNFVEFGVGLFFREPEDGGVDVDVLATGEDGVEAGPEFDEGPEAAAPADGAAVGFDEAGDELEEGGFARPVGPDEPEALAPAELKGDVFQGVEFVFAQSRRASRSGQ